MHLVYIISLVLICEAVVNGFREAPNSHSLQEICNLETFRPECWKNEVIVISEAIYGRRHVGKCIEPDEVSDFAHDRRYLGCFADVRGQLDKRCSGRKQCEIRVPDVELETTRTCLKGMHMFMEVRYSCVEVVEEDRSCSVTLSSSPLHIASSSSRQSNINCGTKTQPWLLEAPAGQRINISLLDFTDSQQLTRSSSSSGSCLHKYGYIIDKSKNVSLCAGISSNLHHVHFSISNRVQIVLSSTLPTDINFLLKLEAVGCSDIIPPEDSWLKREDDKITIGCYTSRQTWQLRCVDGRWTGVLSNCTASAGILAEEPLLVTPQGGSLLKNYEVAVIMSVCFAGLAVCLIIICCGVVCLRRFYTSNGSEKTENSAIKYNYIQASDDVNRRSTGQQSVPSVNTRNNKTTLQQRQYADGSNNHDGGIGSHVTTMNGQYFVLDPEAVARDADV